MRRSSASLADMAGGMALASRRKRRVRGGPSAETSDAAYTLLLLDQAALVLEILERSGVPVVVLKGLAYMASFRPPSDGRRTSDIDLLIRPVDRERASTALLEEGFRQIETPSGPGLVERSRQQAVFHRSVGRASASVDLHWALLDLAPEPLGFSVDHEGLWGRAIPADVCGQSAQRLSNEDLLLHSCLHHAVHDVGSNRRDLDDIQCLLAGAQLDWAAVVERVQAWGVTTPVGWALTRAQREAGAKVPPGVLEALRPQWLWRACAPLLDARARLPLLERPNWERELIRRLETPNAVRAISGLLRLVWPRDGWLAASYGSADNAWRLRLKHAARQARLARRAASRFRR